MSVPPEYALLLQVFLGLGAAALLLGAAAALALTPPAHADRRLAGLVLALAGIAQVNVVRFLEGMSTLHIADPANPWGYWLIDITFLSHAVILALFAVFPSRARWPSWRAGLIALGVVQLAVGGGAWVLDKPLMWNEWPNTGYSGTFLSRLTLGGFVPLAVCLMAAVVLERGARQRPTWLPIVAATVAVLPHPFTGLGEMGARALLHPGGIGGVYGDFAQMWSAVGGDCCGLTVRWWALGILIALAVALMLAWRGARLPLYLGLAWVPVFLLVTSSEVGWGFSELNLIVMAVVMVAAAHRGAFGPFALPGWAGAALAVLALGTVFITVNTVALTIGGDPMTIALGVLAGTGLGLGAAALVAGPSLSWTRWLPQGSGVREGGLAAYRSALQGELEAGQDAGVAAPRLRALRAELGLSDRDHAVLEHALRAAGGRPNAHHLAEGELFLGRYRVARVLGHGASGEVYLARDERLGREVALKRLVEHQRRDAAALARFQEEMRLASALQHPNIVAIHDVETVGEDAYLVMEYVQGGSLAERLQQGPMKEPEATRVTRDLLAALGALHERGIVHRDVKPSNVLLDRAGRAKLGDFTVARASVSGETVGFTHSAGPVGTPAWMAPEQARGVAATARSDLYSTAATLYAALAGRPPVEVADLGEFEARLRVVTAAPALPLPGVSGRTNAVLARALAKDAAERYASAEEMARALG